ncbi:uncharacterized protein [Enoplosus armatus]|uniref:uncharacterized protein isoform X2 n=1 Tax=Enoplosus armatus TaxID=215367 RepID=UPI0039936409
MQWIRYRGGTPKSRTCCAPLWTKRTRERRGNVKTRRMKGPQRMQLQAQRSRLPITSLLPMNQPDSQLKKGRKTICDLNSSSQLLGTSFIKGKVVLKSGLRTYQTKDKEKKFFFYLAVADETASLKVMVYGKKRYKEIKEDKFYMFRKLIKDDKAVKVTTQSVVSSTHSVEVPEELEMEARKLIYSESPVYTIEEAKSSAETVSVEGSVTEINPVEMVKVKDKRKTERQHFQLEDDTDSITISMWGEVTNQCKELSVGDVIKVTNLKRNQHYDTVSLNSTGFTRIQQVHSVGIQNERIQIEGLIKATKKETHLEAAFNQQVHTFVVASRLLAKAFDFKLEGDFKGRLLDKMPLSADAVIKGNKIIEITAA